MFHFSLSYCGKLWSEERRVTRISPVCSVLAFSQEINRLNRHLSTLRRLHQTLKLLLIYQAVSQQLGLRTSFQLPWLTDYLWLAYSPSQMGAYCIYCMLFSSSGGGGRGNIPVCTISFISFSTFSTCLYFLDELIQKPKTYYKNMIRDLDAHEKTDYHQLNAEKALGFLKYMPYSNSLNLEYGYNPLYFQTLRWDFSGNFGKNHRKSQARKEESCLGRVGFKILLFMLLFI